MKQFFSLVCLFSLTLAAHLFAEASRDSGSAFEIKDDWVDFIIEEDLAAVADEADRGFFAPSQQFVIDNVAYSLDAHEEEDEMTAAAPLPQLETVQRSDAASRAPEVLKESVQNPQPKKVKLHESLPKSPTLIDSIREETKIAASEIEINLKEVFRGAPLIYSLLLTLSLFSFTIWFYHIFTIRRSEFLPKKLVKELKSRLISNQFEQALDLCIQENHFFCRLVASGILARKHGLNSMIETMKAEGQRATLGFWQRINLLNDIATIAPMLGLLGTVVGMFYAFYDLNRSMESISILFDGLGISVGTTVVGLIVAIVAMVLYSLAKFRLVKMLSRVESEIQTFAGLIDSKGPNYPG